MFSGAGAASKQDGSETLTACIHQILDNMKTCSIPIVRNLFRIQNAFPMAQLVIPTYEGHGVESQLPRLQTIGGGTGGG